MELRPVAYRTLATRIRNAIRNGEYADGRQLPTEEQLAASYSVSRQTVRRAMQDLVSEGIIYRVAGRGTYPVAEQDRYVNHRQSGTGGQPAVSADSWSIRTGKRMMEDSPHTGSTPDVTGPGPVDPRKLGAR